MNYLAHAFLSFGHDAILTGNIISDFVKGNQKLLYPNEIQKGIVLHRLIDEFTDTHPATRQAKSVFRESAGPYAGIFIDVVYDHFLANDPVHFPETRLAAFAAQTYGVLEQNEAVLPERFRKMLPYMKNQNWLYNYRFEAGIENSFGGVFRRAKYLEANPLVFEAFRRNYPVLQHAYNDFFPDVFNFAFKHFSEML